MKLPELQTYWDSVYVFDNIVDIDLCIDVANSIRGNSELLSGVVINTDPEETRYKFCESGSQDTLIKHLFEINVLDSAEGEYAVRYHEMGEGGRMVWHDDSIYKCSVSIYLSDCVGGELQVMSASGNESLVLAPILGRAVKIKPDVSHCVLDVEEGTRKSLQIFKKK